jgi:ribosome assembly protein 4
VIATSSYDGSIKIWDVVTGEFELEMNARHGCIYAISWDAATPGSSLLASAAVDGTIDIWDTTNGALLRTLQHHEQVGYRVHWSLDLSQP